MERKIDLFLTGFIFLLSVTGCVLLVIALCPLIFLAIAIILVLAVPCYYLGKVIEYRFHETAMGVINYREGE